MPRIVEHQLDARIVEDVMVLVAEEGARAARHRRLDLADHDPLDLGMDRERAGGHAGADADDQDRARMRVEQGRNVPEHALEAHVDVHVGGFDLAGDMKLPRAAFAFGDGDRRGRALSQIQEARDRIPRIHRAAVGDQLPGTAGTIQSPST
jgi:hypothetical protein